ncbi:MAG: SurA N-terminal domain-containing protein [Pseudomonadota bacterium]
MLQTIRDNSKGTLVLGLMFLLFLSFAIWGIDFQFGSQAAPVTVDGETVPLNRIDRAYRQQLQQYQQFYPNGIPPLQLEELKRSVLRATAQEEALYQRAYDLGFRVSDQQLANWIQAQPSFQLGGAFSNDQFALAARDQGMTPIQFEEYIRRALVPEKLRTALVSSAFVTPTERARRGALAQETRSVSYFTIPSSRYLDEVTVTDTEIAAEYEANLADYRTPEAVRLEYIELNPDEIAADISVDEEALRATYEQGVADGLFMREETRKASHILVAANTSDGDDAEALAKAEGLLARVRADEDFAALATEFSDDPGSGSKGGELDWAQRSTFVGPFSDAVFSMAVGDISDVVKTNFGYHIIKLDGIREAEVRSYDDVRSELAQDARLEKADQRVVELSDQVDALVYDYDDSLQPAADETGLPIGETQWVTRTSGPGIGGDPSVREAAFSDSVYSDGRNSDALRYNDGFLYLRIAEKRPARQRELDEVRAQIERKLKSDGAATRASLEGAAVRDRLGAGDLAMADAAAEFDAEVVEAVTLTRRGGGTTPADVVRAAFAAAAPESDNATIGGTAIAGGRYAVFAVEAVTQGGELDAAQASQLTQAVGTLEFRGLVENVFGAADVQIRPDVLP